MLKILFRIPCFFMIIWHHGRAAGAESWTLQESPVVSHLFTVYFISSNEGYAAGDSGVIIKTSDGGQHWYRLNSPTLNAISTIIFTNPDTGWIAGNQGTIFKTTNGGTDWTAQNSNTALDISDIYFLNERLGWGVTLTANPLYLRTTNGGDSWETSQQIGFPINGIFFLDSLNGFSSGGRFDWLGFVNASADGGITWTAVQPIVQETMFDVTFINPQFGITVGGDHDYFGSLAYLTTDGGKAWWLQGISDTVPSPLIGLAFLDSNHAWACGYGKIYSVNPADEQWSLRPEPLTKWTWYGVSFPDKYKGWFVGAEGKILHYDNTPVSVAEPSEMPQKFILCPNYPNPFNPSTMIRCQTAEPAIAELTIYNILGQTVKTVFSGKLPAGDHAWLWNGTNQNNSAVSSGIYIYQLKINHRIAGSRKMLLIR